MRIRISDAIVWISRAVLTGAALWSLGWCGFVALGALVNPFGSFRDTAPGVAMIAVRTFPLLGIAAWVFPTRKSHANPERLCEACGYNLRGNTSGVCPECGTPIWRMRR
ncbi:MAG: hypothetical protein U1D55_05350 [Phycisphaerae bacterium]